MKKHLFIYDFDDTMVKTKNKVYIVNKETNEKNPIDPNLFHKYKLKANESFDVTDFERVTKPKLLPYYYKFVSDYKKFGAENIVILTARHTDVGIKDFLLKKNINNVAIVAIGHEDPKVDLYSYNAERKALWIKNKILSNKDKYKTISFYDDNHTNIETVKTLIKEFPEINFDIVHVVAEE